MSQKFNKLLATLRELFLFDRADLDFGLYRIMNARREEIEEFLTKRLLPSVREHLGTVKAEELKLLEGKVSEAIQMTMDYGGKSREEAEQSEKVLTAKRILHEAADLSSLEDQVFSLLITFFSRYYQEGDFITKRRYSGPGKERYMIPYDGEEVKLVWANMDQYYIKSGENFSNFTFTLDGKTPEQSKRVHFRVKSADTEKDNRKAEEKRAFFLHRETPAEIDAAGDLVLYFEYRPATAADALSEENEKELKSRFGAKNKGDLPGLRNAALALDAVAALGADAHPFHTGLSALAATEAVPLRPLIAKQLHRYVSGNTYDFFIHKDLHAFLSRELDYFLKSEVLAIEDMIDAPEERVRQTLRKAKAVRAIATQLITFLANLEDFQKKLWLKKKFVTAAHYCLTLDRVVQAAEADLPWFTQQISDNAAQLQEWIKLGFLEQSQVDDLREWLLALADRKEGDFTLAPSAFTLHMMLDTAFYNYEFKARLLEKIPDLDAQCNGLLVHSENFQALNLLQDRYRESVNCVYIDPPYNTGNDGFVYKDQFQHSSWNTMFLNRLESAKQLFHKTGVFFASIDENEAQNLRRIADNVFGQSSFEAQIIIQSNKRGQTYQQIAKTHEYLITYATSPEAVYCELAKTISSSSLNDENGPYELWELRNRNPKFGKFNRPNLYYAIYAAPENLDNDGYSRVSLEKSDIFSVEIFPRNSKNEDSCWRWGKDKLLKALSTGNTSVVIARTKKEGGWNVYEKARKSTTKAKTIWSETAVISEQGTIEVGALGFNEFGFPKPLGLLTKTIQVGGDEFAITLDYFAGSGTTGHAVINLNREDGGNRKYILVEMGEHFDTVLKPRIQKVVYSADWKDGVPTAPATGISHCFKYLRLESYEDTLNNLEAKRTKEQQQALDDHPQLKDEYLLGYFLAPETQDSASLLRLSAFRDPWAYKLNLSTSSVGEMQQQDIDLIETFHYLIGLEVHHISRRRSVRPDAAPQRDAQGQWQVKSFRNASYGEEGSWSFQMIHGCTRSGEKTLIIWRTLSGDLELDNAILDAFLHKQDESPTRQDWDLLFVNGDSNLQNLELVADAESTDSQSPARIFKVRMIEKEFKQRMFAATE